MHTDYAYIDTYMHTHKTYVQIILADDTCSYINHTHRSYMHTDHVHTYQSYIGTNLKITHAHIDTDPAQRSYIHMCIHAYKQIIHPHHTYRSYILTYVEIMHTYVEIIHADCAYIQTYTDTHLCKSHMCTCIHTYRSYTFTYIHTYIHTYINTCVYTYMQIIMHIHMHKYKHTDICPSLHTYIHTDHTYRPYIQIMHTHTHTHL